MAARKKIRYQLACNFEEDTSHYRWSAEVRGEREDTGRGWREQAERKKKRRWRRVKSKSGGEEGGEAGGSEKMHGSRFGGAMGPGVRCQINGFHRLFVSHEITSWFPPHALRLSSSLPPRSLLGAARARTRHRCAAAACPRGQKNDQKANFMRYFHFNATVSKFMAEAAIYAAAGLTCRGGYYHYAGDLCVWREKVREIYQEAGVTFCG